MKAHICITYDGLAIASNGCDEAPMLRITRKANGEIVFKISGQLDAENVAEMASVISAEEKGSQIALDLEDLISVDGEAAKVLEKCEGETIELKNCSAYIREWISRERLRRKSQGRPKK